MANNFPEIVLTVLTLSMTFLAILSRTRRRTILFYSTAVSLVCYSLVFYIIGVALSAQPSRDDDSASIACCALLLVGLAKSTVRHNIPDGHTGVIASSYEQLLQMVFVLVLVLPPWSFGHRALFGILVGAVFLLWVGQLRARLWSTSARSRVKEDLLISEYMSKKHNAKQDLGPTDFQGLNYIVSGEVSRRDSIRLFWMELGRKRYIPNLCMGSCIPGAIVNPVIRYDTLVTIEDVWKHIDSLQGRDVCLSFALFKLLRRRFRRCFLHESAHDKTTQLFVCGLLSSQSQNPLRAFHIIEAELGFVFDFFFSCPPPDYPSTIVFTMLTGYLCNSNYVNPLFMVNLCAFAGLGFLQLVSSTLTNRHMVDLVVNICRRHKRSSTRRYTDIILLLMVLMSRGVIWVRRMGIAASTYSFETIWSNRVGQYCLFHCDYRGFTTRLISNEAKEALLNALRWSHGKLSDGRSSLSRNEARELGWACDQEFVAEKILVWHIATTLCHVGQLSRDKGRVHVLKFKDGQSKEKRASTVTMDNHLLATMLSDYCAYLVAFFPELIADDIYATRLVFDNGRAAAAERLEGEGSLGRMHQSAAMMDLEGTDFAATAQHDVVFKGKMLAAQLIRLEDDILWKVLAEFWAELMLFVSPSHNSAAHLERLKDGGELITHIWALLTHAGIMERPSGQEDHTASNESSVHTSMRGEATSSGPAQSEIEVVIESSSNYFL